MRITWLITAQYISQEPGYDTETTYLTVKDNTLAYKIVQQASVNYINGYQTNYQIKSDFPESIRNMNHGKYTKIITPANPKRDILKITLQRIPTDTGIEDGANQLSHDKS